MTLNGSWQLYFAPEDPAAPQDAAAVREKGTKIPAQVPGNIELDLERAGLEPEPYRSDNLYRFRKYEFYCWLFEREFTFDKTVGAGSRIILRFEGLNNFAKIYLNGALVGEAHNSLIEHEFDVTGSLRAGSNTISVHIRSAMNECRRYYYPAMTAGHADDFTFLRMPPSSFGWDILGRFVSAGMWRGVSLEERKPTRFGDLYFATVAADGKSDATLFFNYNYHTDAFDFDGFRIRVEGRCGESVFSDEFDAPFISGHRHIHVGNACFWWPRGYGDADIYSVRVSLIRDGAVMDERIENIGIRKVRLDTVYEPGDKGEFAVYVNGVRIMCKGSNHVPLSALHSQDADRYEKAVAMYADLGCNIVRCWGGNVYEDHKFFDLCDRAGIMVWQDFAMACSSYVPTDEFKKEMELEAASVIIKLRNHPSVILWAGDNEVDETVMGQGMSDFARYNEITREVLPRAVRVNDPFRDYIPSSPYVPDGMDHYSVPEQHNWGARAYFKDEFYRNSSAHFISECGYHGCPSVESLKKFVPPERLDLDDGNPVTGAHSTEYAPEGRERFDRIRLMKRQVEVLCGEVPSDLDEFSALSQISQAEAKKFFIERARALKWRRTGIIWWNLLDGWPQISDAVVDWYFDKKLAYHYIKRSQEPVCVIIGEERDWSHPVILCNDTRDDCRVGYEITDGETGETVLSGSAVSAANENIILGTVGDTPGEKHLWLISWTIGGRRYFNHYIAGHPPFDKERLLAWRDVILAKNS